MVDEKYISRIVESVIQNMDVKPDKNLKGVFDTMEEALEAVSKAYTQFRSYTVEQREKMIAEIRRLTLEEAGEMARLGVEESSLIKGPSPTLNKSIL